MCILPPQISRTVPGFPIRVIGLVIYKEWTRIVSAGSSITSPRLELSISF